MSNTFYFKNDNELYHFGILGMKWGVRRYQNTDGSLTTEGLRRYRKAESDYNDAKKKYASAKKNGASNLNNYKANVKIAKKNLKQDYKQLKYDKKADKGKRLYRTGYRILADRPLEVAAKGLATVAALSQSLKYMGINDFLSNDQLNKISYASGAAAVASELANVAYYGPKDSNLRAYYGHSREKDTPLMRIKD